ncbi:MAG: DNA-3-methyladenine glycosylase 2 family protein [Acidobacteria bacterium]|nr:DNA-3-methyladenine glycosylase 2 family protein [Acidobacteriota bacterium]
MNIHTIGEQDLAPICAELAAKDADLAFIFGKYGAPPLWARAASFATLVQIILEQQVSLASAAAAFNKLREKTGEVTPENLLRLTDDELRACYFSRQKTVYARGLARALVEKSLDLRALETMSDADARHALKRVKGIGDWTADIYLLMALRRADVMPKGDLALHVAYKKLKGLAHAPHADEFQRIAESWQPHRAVAARLLWHFYLSEKAGAPSS